VTPELTVIGLNLCIIAVAYTSVFPTVAGSNVSRIALLDLAASAVAIGIVGSVYWGSDYAFSLLIVDVNWFWFTLLTYALFEIPAYMWYAKKNRIKL